MITRNMTRFFLPLLSSLAALSTFSLVQGQQNTAYRVYVSNEYGADVTVLDGATDEVTSTISISGRPGEVRPRGLAVSPDGETVYVSISDFFPERETPEDLITAIDVETNDIVTEIRAGGESGACRHHPGRGTYLGLARGDRSGSCVRRCDRRAVGDFPGRYRT